MNRVVWISALWLLAPLGASAQTLNLTTDPPGAKIYHTERTGVRMLLGTGVAKFKLQKDQPNQLVIEAAGFAPETANFTRGEKYPKDLTVRLKKRLVKVTVLPYDAVVRFNGNVVGSGAEANYVIVPEGTVGTLEVAKDGFKTETRVYRYLNPGDVVPEAEHIELKDRVVRVRPAPATARVTAEGAAIPLDQEGSAWVVVPVERCVNVQVTAVSYQAVDTRFCNTRDEARALDREVRIALQHRLTRVQVTPGTAQIELNGRVAGVGQFAVTTPYNQCVKMVVSAPGFAKTAREYCNKPDSTNIAAPPGDDQIVLTPDEAYAVAIQSDQANVNFTIEVNPRRSGDDAWSTVSQVILDKFDVLEATDRASGYMRTAWQVNYYPTSTVRTRVIVKLGNAKPLKYVVKIASEHADGRVSVKDDDQFQEWPYILNTYKDIINELQSRLR